ncbi:imidazolonepropionase [Priestia megaterium]|uniref:imidazolonepropionase n=1 Tax=Priestia TaxID=2800373 RepID=UPI000BF61A88|nr:imidazolonepropionase [Priestia megaterium]MED4619313.1 imidazolonepropionase [Priestia megaterium]PEZ50971.1 imidazolonepropionase [Priestia megaterium]PFI59036.1 imidazolonepropionase [Priestia megaterium]PGK58006.1 imidazolonepropionase [Priestia megaterium]PGR29878.1 imidazolonepropionase [Priestia megaterium]
MSSITYIKRASQLITVRGGTKEPKRAQDMSDIGIIEHGSVVVENGLITFVGSDVEAERYVHTLSGHINTIEASGKIVTPGLIDAHTHIVFGGSREKELEMRLNGAKYIDILKAGGGILQTTTSTREATEEQLIQETSKRLNRFLQYGVTTVEAKSGYGLTLEDELKQLRAAKKLDERHPIDIVSTFMGAHAVPVEYKENPDEFVRLVIEEMIPRVAEENLAEFCDVFCEEGVFTIEQSEQILEAGKVYGLKPKIHADEIVQFGGAELAAKVGAVSADHLLQASDEGIKQMAKSGVIAVLLPGTAFFLMEKPANARKMMEAGVPVALSTDRNPGSSPTESLPFIMNLACLTMKMTPAEVLTACTINAAHAIGRADEVGSIEVGKKGDLVLFDAPNYQTLQYNYAVNLVDTVIKKGKVIVEGGALCDVPVPTT